MYGFYAPISNPSAPKIADSDLSLISARGFTLLSRRNGFDKRERPSAWFLYQKTVSPLRGSKTNSPVF